MIYSSWLLSLIRQQAEFVNFQGILLYAVITLRAIHTATSSFQDIDASRVRFCSQQDTLQELPFRMLIDIFPWPLLKYESGGILDGIVPLPLMNTPLLLLLETAYKCLGGSPDLSHFHENLSPLLQPMRRGVVMSCLQTVGKEGELLLPPLLTLSLSGEPCLWHSLRLCPLHHLHCHYGEPFLWHWGNKNVNIMIISNVQSTER